MSKPREYVLPGTREPVTIADVFESLKSCLAFHARDWSTDKRDAWLYGIVCGWGDALGEVAKQHGWTLEAVERLKRLRKVAEKAERQGEGRSGS